MKGTTRVTYGAAHNGLDTGHFSPLFPVPHHLDTSGVDGWNDLGRDLENKLEIIAEWLGSVREASDATPRLLPDGLLSKRSTAFTPFKSGAWGVHIMNLIKAKGVLMLSLSSGTDNSSLDASPDTTPSYQKLRSCEQLTPCSLGSAAWFALLASGTAQI